jgi:hypothetical protein
MNSPSSRNINMTTPVYGSKPDLIILDDPANESPTPSAPRYSPIPGPNILLMGDSGTGKTHSIGTLSAMYAPGEEGVWVPHGAPHMETFVVFTEPGMEVLSTIPCTHLHWTFIPPARASWETMIKVQTKVNTMSPETLAKQPDIEKASYKSFLTLLGSFQNFKCDRCGRAYGDVTTWGTNRALVLDSMSGLAVMAMQHVVGGKPNKSPANWGMAMDGIEGLINKLTMDTRCWFIMTAHQERELDEITGVQNVMPSTLGRKLAPKIPRFFSEVVQTNRNGTKFSWSTAAINTTTKARHLPLAPVIDPSTDTISVGWQKAGGILEFPPEASASGGAPEVAPTSS